MNRPRHHSPQASKTRPQHQARQRACGSLSLHLQHSQQLARRSGSVVDGRAHLCLASRICRLSETAWLTWGVSSAMLPGDGSPVCARGSAGRQATPAAGSLQRAW